MIKYIRLPDVKAIRAEVIRDHLPPGIGRVVCLSCGHASRALEAVIDQVPVVSMDSRSPILATRELSIDEQWRLFGPDSLNATSGYLPLDWVEEIGQRLMRVVPQADRYFVPCGSGETIQALSFFIPLAQMVGVTAAYPPLEMMGPLSRWLRANADVRHAGRVRSVVEALQIVARGSGIALYWE